MAWARFDDSAIDHPKFLALSHGAFRLWFEGISYCSKHLTDGLISRLALKGFRYVSRPRIEELLAHQLWEHHDVGFKVHDYLDWNDSREEIMAKREAARDRSSRARSRERSQNVLSGVGITSSVDQKKEEERAAAFAEFWAFYPRRVGRTPAERAWAKLDPDPALRQTMLHALDVQKRSPQWTKDGGQFVPHPATWLNQRRWEDEPEKPAQHHSYVPPTVHQFSGWEDECKRLHNFECGHYRTHDLRVKLEEARRASA